MIKTYVSNSVIPMTTKLGRVVTYGGETPFNYSCDLSMMWSGDK